MDKSTSNNRTRSSIKMETVSYEVLPNDTLTSIAAHFDMRCSELKLLNKLIMDQVYIGQKLQIYKKNFEETEKRFLEDKKLVITENLFDSYSFESSASETRSRHSSSATSEHLRSRNASGRQDNASDHGSESAFDRVIHDFKRNRLRLDVKYVTDGQGVVSGTLLITKNTIMFNPNVSDRLVMDRGSTSYAMVVPFEYIVRLAIVDDIAAMKWKKGCDGQEPVIYHGNVKEYEFNSELPGSDIELVGDPEPEELTKQLPLPDVVNGSLIRGGDDLLINCVNSSESDSDQETSVSAKTVNPLRMLSQQSNGSTDQVCLRNFFNKDVNQMTRENITDWPIDKSPRPGLFSLGRCANGSVSLFPVVDGESDVHFAAPSSSQDEGVNDNHLHGISILTDSTLSQNSSFHSGVSSYDHRTSSFCRKQSFSAAHEYNSLGTPTNLLPVYSAKSISRIASTITVSGSVGSFSIPPGQHFLLDYGWEKFEEVNMEGDRWCDNVRDLPPLPEDSTSQIKQADFYFSDEEDENFSKKKSKEVSSEVDIEKLLKSDYKSFEVTRPRPATQYKDLPMYLCTIIGCPITTKDKRASVSTAIEPFSMENMKPAYWFSIHRCDVKRLFDFIMNHFSDIYGSEDEVNPASRGLVIFSLDMINSKASFSESDSFVFELDPILPAELSENSSIFDASQISKLNSALFPRAKDSYWKLVYSTLRDGTSLHTLYRKTRDELAIDPPSVIVVRDSFKMVFGAVLSCTVRKSTEYYGNGESFLFTFKDGFKKYLATGANEYYGYGFKDGLCFGAYRGKCGLWLDGDLIHGRTQKCVTYGNDVLSMTEDFLAQDLEIWCLY